MNQPETIWKACEDLAKSHPEFTVSQIVIRAWQAKKELFGLEGFHHLHPNANKVISTIVGKKGLVARGCLIRVRPKVYRLGVPLDTVNDMTRLERWIAKLSQTLKRCGPT